MKTLQKKLTERIENERTMREDQDFERMNALVFLSSKISIYRDYFTEEEYKYVVKDIRRLTRSIIDSLKEI